MPAENETKEQQERRVLGGQPPLRPHAPAELLVQPFDHVGGPERLPLALREPEEREQLLTAFLEAADHARAAGRPLPLEGHRGQAGRRDTLGVDDAMEVSPNLREGVLRRLALEVPQLVDSTTLDQRLGPDEADGLPEAGVSVDHAPHWAGESARGQVVETPLPSFERLAPRAELQRQKLLLPVGEDGDDAQDRDAHDLPG